MKSLTKMAGLAGILALTLATATVNSRAAPLNATALEGQAVVMDLAPNASAVIYWVRESDGWHVVTTVDVVFGRDSAAERHAIVRFSAVLLPGQRQLISVPAAIGEQQRVLSIRRLGDRIEVAQAPGSSV